MEDEKTLFVLSPVLELRSFLVSSVGPSPLLTSELSSSSHLGCSVSLDLMTVEAQSTASSSASQETHILNV